MGKIVVLASQIAAQEGIAETGYRLLTNQGQDANQIVEHLHWHVIGGRRLGRIG
jgi:histidine triad (HIT) family protein